MDGYWDIFEDAEVCVTITDWATPATVYAERRVAEHRIRRMNYGRGWYRMSGLDDKALFRVRHGHPLVITSLEQRTPGVGWHGWMVDDPPHWKAMQAYAAEARGPVLCGGLGLGLIQHALADQPAVDFVQTIEREEAVIELVKPELPHDKKNLRIIQADWNDVIHDRATAIVDWGMIVIDLWVASGIREKMEAFADAARMYYFCRVQWPDAKVVIHGFAGLTDVTWKMSEKTLAAMKRLADAEERE